MMVEGNYWLGEGGITILYFHPNFLVLTQGIQSCISGAVLLCFTNTGDMFPASQLQGAALGKGPHCCRGDFSPPGNALLWAQQWAPGSLVTTLPHWGDPALEGGASLPVELCHGKTISNDLGSASQTCLLICSSLILTLAFCSWSGWNGFGFGFSSFIIILECHILWNAKQGWAAKLLKIPPVCSSPSFLNLINTQHLPSSRDDYRLIF